jgi:hypothetical protein
MFIRLSETEAGTLAEDVQETVQLIEIMALSDDGSAMAEGFSIGKLNFLKESLNS